MKKPLSFFLRNSVFYFATLTKELIYFNGKSNDVKFKDKGTIIFIANWDISVKNFIT